MSNVNSNYDKIFLFDIHTGNDGFAEFVEVHQREPIIPLNEAVGEIERVSPPDYQLPEKWRKEEIDSYAAGGLDMRFDECTKALVFVRLPYKEEDLTTEFGENVVVDLHLPHDIPGNIVRECRRLALTEGGLHLLCSFELDLGDSLNVMRRPTTGHPISRLPIMFDFVDRDDHVSPVYKDPHHHKAAGEDPVIGHGGIHPPSAASMIVVN